MKNEIVSNIQRRQAITKERARLREEAEILRGQQRKINSAFIAEQLEIFISEIKRTSECYIRYNVSSSFTKFVNRSGIYLNQEHADAVYDYNEAKENLNKIFVDSLLENKNNEQQKIIACAGVKNIQDMQNYFN